MDGLISWFRQLQWYRLLPVALSAVGCLVCIIFHELCHGLAALAMGDDTARREGRLSFNPLRHIDLVGLLMLLTVHFGWAKPVPVNPARFRRPRLGMAVTALAGPLGNFLLAALLAFFYGLSAAWFDLSQGQSAYWVTAFLGASMSLSIGLGIFNLFPIPPLDGSKVLFSVLPSSAYFRLMQFERYGMILLVALLFFGVLDTPLSFLRDGMMNGMIRAISEPAYRLGMNII